MNNTYKAVDVLTLVQRGFYYNDLEVCCNPQVVNTCSQAQHTRHKRYMVTLYVRKGFDPPPVICGSPKKLLLTGVTSSRREIFRNHASWGTTDHKQMGIKYLTNML